MAPADIGFGVLQGDGLVFAAFDFRFKQFGTQHVPRHRAVAMLRAVLLTFDDGVGRNMRQSHRRLGLVNVLAAGTARTHDVGANVLLVDLDLDAIVYHRKHNDAGK